MQGTESYPGVNRTPTIAPHNGTLWAPPIARIAPPEIEVYRLLAGSARPHRHGGKRLAVADRRAYLVDSTRQTGSRVGTPSFGRFRRIRRPRAVYIPAFAVVTVLCGNVRTVTSKTVVQERGQIRL